MLGRLRIKRATHLKGNGFGRVNHAAASQQQVGRKEHIDYLFVCPSLLEPASKRGGGIEEVDFQVATHLPESYHIVILGAFLATFRKRIPAAPNVLIEFVGFPAPRSYPPSSKGEVFWMTVLGMPLFSIPLLVKLVSLRRARPACLVVHNGLPGLLACFVYQRSTTRIVYSEGNVYPWVNPFPSVIRRSIPQRGMRLFKIITGRIIGKLAWCIRAQSEAIKRGLASNAVSGYKTTVIPGGVDPSFYLPTRNVRNDETIGVGFVGRLDDAKGAPLLLEIVALASRTQSRLKFVILGEGLIKSKLKEFANVEHVGWVDRDQLREKLSAVSIVLTFQKEFGLGELEAMATAKAIVASNKGEVSKIIKDRDNGLLCDTTPESYVSCINELINDPGLLARVSARARETVVERFSWQTIAREWLRMTLID